MILANESALPAGSHISPLANQVGHQWRPWGQRRSSVNADGRLPFKVCHLDVFPKRNRAHVLVLPKVIGTLAPDTMVIGSSARIHRRTAHVEPYVNCDTRDGRQKRGRGNHRSEPIAFEPASYVTFFQIR